MVEHTAIYLSKEFAEKHKEYYYISQLDNGKYVMNIASKHERKEHVDILEDLEDILKEEPYDVYGVVLWEDGRVDRIDLKTGREETMPAND